MRSPTTACLLNANKKDRYTPMFVYVSDFQILLSPSFLLGPTDFAGFIHPSLIISVVSVFCLGGGLWHFPGFQWLEVTQVILESWFRNPIPNYLGSQKTRRK